MNSDPEINALKYRTNELEDAIAQYKAQEEKLIDMLQRIVSIAEEECD